ncbi:MAG: ATP-binding cassette domain-containing protein, partial [Promethearchaeota archaeon]
MENKTVIKLENISKIYGEGRNQIVALKQIDLDIDEGKIITIMGPSGSGKSTLLNILGAMDSPTEGKVLVDGVDIGGMKEKKLSGYRKNTIGFIFQDFYLIPNLDVLGNVLI